MFSRSWVEGSCLIEWKVMHVDRELIEDRRTDSSSVKVSDLILLMLLGGGEGLMSLISLR
jgi:hypothetical protein